MGQDTLPFVRKTHKSLKGSTVGDPGLVGYKYVHLFKRIADSHTKSIKSPKRLALQQARTTLRNPISSTQLSTTLNNSQHGSLHLFRPQLLQLWPGLQMHLLRALNQRLPV